MDGKTDFSENCRTDIFNENNEYKGVKDNVCVNDSDLFLNKWLISKFNKSQKNNYAWVNTHHGNDFSQQNYIWFQNECDKSCYIGINPETFKEAFIYVSVFTCIQHTWLNDRDQFTAPFFEEVEDKQNPLQKVKHYFYEDDQDFINNCIVYAIFTKNYTDWNLFDNGELNLQNANRDLEVWWLLKAELNKGLTQQAQDVYNSALAICKFYHQNKCGKNYEHNGKIITDYQYKVNASWNDILNGVKGVKLDKNGKAKRNNGCDAYPKAENLFITFREDLKLLAKEVEKGVYKYGFLRG